MSIEIKTTLSMSVDMNKYFPSLSKRLREEIIAEIIKLASGNGKDVVIKQKRAVAAGVQKQLPNLPEPGHYSAALPDTREIIVLKKIARAGTMLAIVQAIHAKWAPGKTMLLGDLRLIVMNELENAKRTADSNAVNVCIHNMMGHYVQLKDGF